MTGSPKHLFTSVMQSGSPVCGGGGCRGQMLTPVNVNHGYNVLRFALEILTLEAVIEKCISWYTIAAIVSINISGLIPIVLNGHSFA